ncbi:MAG: ABC transporter substrate-binding protein [Nocardioides sp.]|uniref:ABC transporter substrate-binding protein n=1 Tax=Nocardioides sp. TaxID=35761 RepID=UPI0039E54EEE
MPQPSVTRRTVLQGTGAAALVALIAACSRPGGDKSDDNAATGKFSAQEIDELVVAIPATLSTLYPGQEAGNFNYYVAALVAEGLVAPDGTGKLVAALAESWKQTDPTTYVYTLREDAKFSDGSPMTVDDVLYSIELARSDKHSPNIAYYWANTTSVKKTGDREVTIALKSPDVAFEWGPCAANALWITSKKYVEAHDGKLGTPDAFLMGTGPYRVTKFQPDSTLELERVDTWWGGQAPVKKVRIDFIEEESTRLLARESGDIDLALAISLDQAQQWEDTEDTTVMFAPDRSYVGIDFNTAVEPFDDIHVRRAIAMCCDRKAFVDKLLGGHGEVATALTTPQQIESVLGGADAAREALAPVLEIDFDVDAAKAELAKSKVPDGFSTTVGVSTSAPQISQAFQALAQAVDPLGIKIEVKEMPVEKWYGTIGSEDWGLAYMWYFNATGDPAELATWFFGEGNPASFSNDDVNDLMAQQRKETDPAKRVQLIIEAQKVALEELPYFPLWWGEAATAINDHYTIEEFGSYTFLSPWTPRILTRES